MLLELSIIKDQFYYRLYFVCSKRSLNITPQTVKRLEGNRGGKPPDTGLGNDFIDVTPKAQATKAKINK